METANSSPYVGCVLLVETWRFIKSEYITNGWQGLSLLKRCDKTQCDNDTYQDFNENNELPIKYNHTTLKIPMDAIQSIRKRKERYEGYSQTHMSPFSD